MSTSNLFANVLNAYHPWKTRTQQRNPRVSPGFDRTCLPQKGTTVSKLMAGLTQIPPRTILLGQCTDGLPMLFSLNDPEIGSILIEGGTGCGKTHQLQVMVDSACRANAPHEMQIAILTLHTRDWDYLSREPRQDAYLRGVHAWYDPRAAQLIESLTTLAEARREGHRKGPAVLLVLDDLQFVEELSYEAQVNLHWLLAYGSQSDVWLVGTLQAEQVASFQYWVETFRTRVIGQGASKKGAEPLDRHPRPQVEDLDSGTFRVWTGEDWLTYRLPLIG